MEEFRLDGLKALVTGGSRGIGFGIARSLAEAGAEVTLVARSEEKLGQAVEQLKGAVKPVLTYAFDMGEIDKIESLYTQIIADTGGIDILVNNAGTTRRNLAEDMSLADWDTVIRLNLTAIFALSQQFGKERIRSEKRGKIINIASLMSDTVREKNTPYAASKGGVRQLTKAFAVDWARYGINVNAIGPGYIQTDLTQPLWEDPKFDSWVKERTPLGRWGQPADLGSAAVFLASKASDFITGQILYVDGGWLSTF